MCPTKLPADPEDDVAVTIRIPKALFIMNAPPPATVTQKTVEQHFGITPRAYKAMVRDGMFPVKKIGRAIFSAYDDVKRVVTEGAQLRKRVDLEVSGDAAHPERLPMGPQEVIRYIEAARTPKEEKERREEMSKMIFGLCSKYGEKLDGGSPNPNRNDCLHQQAIELLAASWSAKSVPRPPRVRRSRRRSR